MSGHRLLAMPPWQALGWGGLAEDEDSGRGCGHPGGFTCLRCAPQQMDNAVYTFETLLHQELGKGPTKEELCKSIQRVLERVLKVSGPTPCPRPS